MCHRTDVLYSLSGLATGWFNNYVLWCFQFRRFWSNLVRFETVAFRFSKKIFDRLSENPSEKVETKFLKIELDWKMKKNPEILLSKKNEKSWRRRKKNSRKTLMYQNSPFCLETLCLLFVAATSSCLLLAPILDPCNFY